MKKWHNLKSNEKGLVLIIAILLIGIALNWGRVWKGMTNGVNHYLKHQEK